MTDTTSTTYFVTIKEACRLIGGDKPISKQTFYRLAARGVVPPPIKVAPNCSRVPFDALRVALQTMMAPICTKQPGSAEVSGD